METLKEKSMKTIVYNFKTYNLITLLLKVKSLPLPDFAKGKFLLIMNLLRKIIFRRNSSE